MLRGPSIMVNSDDDDEIVNINRNSDSTFRLPKPVGNGVGGLFGSSPIIGSEMLVNRSKVTDVRSLSSSGSPSEASDTTESDNNSNKFRNQGNTFVVNNKDNSSDSDDDDESESDNSPQSNPINNHYKHERSRMENQINEKKEILYQMDRLESKGHRLPRKFTLQSDYEEMKTEYNRILREKEVDAAIRFQRKMLMAFVTGLEFLNTRFDPFDVKLDGWSEQVHENVNDYDDIFEELHEKYKSTGKKMPAEIRLLLSLSGSAFMFHLTNSMFKQSNLPGVEEVIRSNPDLMRQFQQAAVNKMQPPQSPSSGMGGGGGGMGGGMGGMFGMMGNMFNMASPPQQSRQSRPREDDIENIIGNISAEIKSGPPSTDYNRVETMSISDEEITSIIEDTADLNGILMNGKKQRAPARRQPKKNTKTLNI